jgi:glycosyltransferase involved in cell wall biosynthesis
MKKRKKILRACTASETLHFMKGMLPRLKQQYEVLLLSSPGEGLDIVCEKYGIKGYGVHMERHISLCKDLVSLIKLVKLFYQVKPQMVHSITPKAGLLCMIAAWLTRVPVRVHTFTGLIWPTSTGLRRRILMTTDKMTCTFATHVVPEGEGVKNDLLNNGITKKPLKVLGYGNIKGIDLKLFSRRPEVMEIATRITQASKKFTFLYVGRLVGDKGINELVAAFLRLNNTMPNSRLVLIGMLEERLDPLSEDTQRRIETHPDIEAVGAKGGDELIAYYATADCFVHPSYREGFPNVVLEAGAMGTPCIVTDINGSREIIKEGENGVIVPPQDEQALYDAMLKMMTDNEARQRMAGNARRMIADRFDMEFVQQCLLDFYKDILKD